MASPGNDLVENALQTLATAASLEVSHEEHRTEIPMDLIDPLLQNQTYNAFGHDQYDSTTSLMNLSIQPLPLQAEATEPTAFTTPVQQTRSGRISRPPALDSQQAFFANLQNPNALPLNAAAVQQVTNAVIQNWHLFAGQLPGSGLGPGSGTGPGPNYGESDAGSTPRQATTSQTGGKRKKRWTTTDDDEDEAQAEADEEEQQQAAAAAAPPLVIGPNGAALPEWPLPPKGPKSRKTMPREEMLARRRARNKVAAVESRKKKKEQIIEKETKLQEAERMYAELLARYNQLEDEVIRLRSSQGKAGQSHTNDYHRPTQYQHHYAHPLHQQDQGVGFSALFSEDENDEDPEFIPSSPVHHPNDHSGSDSGSSDEDDDDDDDAEDEDLFLPITDVPVPAPPSDVQRIMNEHGLDLNTLKLLGENARKQGLLN